MTLADYDAGTSSNYSATTVVKYGTATKTFYWKESGPIVWYCTFQWAVSAGGGYYYIDWAFSNNGHNIWNYVSNVNSSIEVVFRSSEDNTKSMGFSGTANSNNTAETISDQDYAADTVYSAYFRNGSTTQTTTLYSSTNFTIYLTESITY